MTPLDYINHARAIGKTEEWIKRNYHAVTTGRLYGVAGALTENQRRQDKQIRGDAEVADKKARHGGSYSTKYCADWRKQNGYTILAIEYTDRRGNKHDVMGSWDLMCSKRGHGLVADQAFGKDKFAEHARKVKENGGLERAIHAGCTCWMHEFIRGNPVPVRSWHWDTKEERWIETN